MQKIRVPLFFYGLLLALSASGNVYSADSDDVEKIKFYDVEVIIFKNTSVPRGDELNLPTPSPAYKKNTLNLSGKRSLKKARKKGFIPLNKDEFRLQDTVSRIKKSSRYDLLSHTGWRQPGLEEQKSIPVWVKGGQVFGSEYSSIDQPDTGSSTSSTTQGRSNSSSNTEKPEDRNVLYELEGEITISLARYLHTQANLVLRKPATIRNILGNSPNRFESSEIETVQGRRLLNYNLNEKRRMRSKKLHYLDHPHFGMLVLITPYTQPAPPANEESQVPVENKDKT